MSGSGRITFEWADGEHTFRLAIGQLRELQDKCSAGPMEILDRLAGRTWRVDDVRETIRLGLMGGGKGASEALTFVKRYVDDAPLTDNVHVAQAILLAALIGVSDDPVGAQKKSPTDREMEKSSSPATSPTPAS